MEAYKDGREPLWYNQWQQSYGVSSKKEMTKLLVSMGYQFEWLPNDFLRLKFTNSGMMNY